MSGIEKIFDLEKLQAMMKEVDEIKLTNFTLDAEKLEFEVEEQ